MKGIGRILIVLSIWSSCKSRQASPDGEVMRAYADSAWAYVPQIEARIVAPLIKKDTARLILPYLQEVEDYRPYAQHLVDSLSAEGGGVVFVPAGRYTFLGPLHLKSGVQLHLADSAKIIFSDNPAHYLPLVKVRWEGTVCYNYSPLIYAYRQKNIAITGKGVVEGNGAQWSKEWRKKQKPDKAKLRQMGNDTIPEGQRVFGQGFLDLDKDGQDDGFGDGQAHFLRPSLIEFYACENIWLEDFTAQNSPFWTIHPVFCKNISIRGLRIRGSTLNDDGIDPDSCEDVLIENCDIATHDDAISIKAGRDQDAWSRPGSKHIIVRNNHLRSGVNALCIGSEMSGGVESVFMTGNNIGRGKHAFNFKCNLDRGGVVKDVFIRGNKIDSCSHEMLIFRMDYHGYRGNYFPTTFKRFFVEDLSAQKVGSPFKITGVEAAPIRELYFHNISIRSSDTASRFDFMEKTVFNKVEVEGRPEAF